MSTGDDPRPDEELVEAINEGDRRAFEVLYRRHRDWVVRLAYRFTRDEDAALDVLQETFAYFLGKFPGFELRAKLTTFFYPVVKNVSIRLRERGRRFASSDEALEAATAPPAPEDDPRAELAAVLEGLSDIHSEVVLMRFVDDLSLEDIALALEIPLGTVKSRLHKAIEALRESPRVRRYFEP